jgi:ABC-type uncharacterized transport system permease subunit
MLPINRHPSARELRSFARIWFPAFVALVGAVLYWRVDRPAAAAAVWAVGAAAAIAVLASPAIARVVFVGLLIVTYPIGLVVSTLALAALFYLVFTPIGWAMRLAGRDPLRLRARGGPSDWQPVTQDDDPQRAFRQF